MYLKVIAMLSLAVFIGACSGGGGSGNSSSRNSNSLTLSASSIDMRGYVYEDVNEFDRRNIDAFITANYQGAGVIAGFVPGEEAAQEWLNIEVDQETPGRVRYRLNVYGWGINPFTNYSTTLRFVTGDLDGGNLVIRDVPLTFKVGRYFYLNQQTVDMRKVQGAALGIEEKLMLFASDSHWSIENKPEWVTLSAENGIGSTSLDFSCNNQADIIEGRANGVVIVRDTSVEVEHRINVSCKTIPVSVSLSDYGIALTQLADASALSSTVDVRFSGDVEGVWSASSDQEWLIVTRTGDSRTPLEVSANSDDLADGQMHYASITVSSELAPQAEIIRVGLYKNTSVSLAASTWNIDFPYEFLDPIRPYAYRHEYFEGVYGYDNLAAINIYTGEKAFAIDLSGKCLRAEDISSDGNKIFFIETAYCNSELQDRESTKIYSANLGEMNGNLVLLVDIPISEYRGYIDLDLKSVINNGVPAIIIHLGLIYHAETGLKLGDFTPINTGYEGVVSAPKNGELFYSGGFIDGYVYSLFLPSDEEPADVRLVHTVEKAYDEPWYELGQYFFHPNGALLITPKTCIRKDADFGWQTCTLNSGTFFWDDVPGVGLISTYDINQTLELILLDESFAYIRSISEHQPHGYRSPQLSSDGLAVLTSYWVDAGARTRWLLLPLNQD